ARSHRTNDVLRKAQQSYFPRCHAEARAACCHVPMPPAPARSRQKTSSWCISQSVSAACPLRISLIPHIGGDPRRTEISFCDRYDSRALSAVVGTTKNELPPLQ